MDYSRENYKIGAIVIAYNPSTTLFKKCIDSIISQVNSVCVVDNSATDNSYLLTSYGNELHYIPLLCNKGIAAAQNIGIKYFCEQGYDFVVFSDQDSTSTGSLIQNLTEAFFVLSSKEDIACIGPMPINRKTGKPYLFEKCIIDKCEYSGIQYYKMYSIISSYSFVPLAIFSEVGLMEERLFIDFVDDQWCWRAALKHKVSIMLPKTSIAHEQGVSSTFLGHTISISSVFRIYYQTRNLIWLCRKNYVPSYWKKMNLKKLIIKFFYYSIIPKQRFYYCQRMIKGLFAGIVERL